MQDNFKKMPQKIRSASPAEKRKTPAIYDHELIDRTAKDLRMPRDVVSKAVHGFVRTLRDELVWFEKDIVIRELGTIVVWGRFNNSIGNLKGIAERRPDLVGRKVYPVVELKLLPDNKRQLVKNTRFTDNRKLIPRSEWMEKEGLTLEVEEDITTEAE